MADTESLAQVDQLLQQRAQYEQWLTKLGGAGSKAPEAVRAKVRADYEGRLEAVVAELRTHASAVETALNGHREELAGLEARRADIEERLAEAEIRHSVGEFTEDEWNAVGAEAESALQEIGKRASVEQEAIGRLADILTLIAKPATPALKLESSAPSGQVVDISTLQPPEGQGAPRFVPKTPGQMRAASPPRQAAPPARDELDFLKSVTGEHQTRRAAPPPRKGDSGPMRAIAVDTPTEATPAADAEGKSSTPTNAKTLKCGECGTLNRPTEWYCERCGAVLSAL